MRGDRGRLFRKAGAAIAIADEKKETPLEQMITLRELELTARWVDPNKKQYSALNTIIEKLAIIEENFPHKKEMMEIHSTFNKESKLDPDIDRFLALLYSSIEILIESKKAQLFARNPTAKKNLENAEKEMTKLRWSLILRKDRIINAAKEEKSQQSIVEIKLIAESHKIKSKIKKIYLDNLKSPALQYPILAPKQKHS